MELSVRQIRPENGNIIVKVDRRSKSTHSVDGTDVTISIDRSYGWNEREKNPVNGIVESSFIKGIDAGDEVVCWHNCFHESRLVHEWLTPEGRIHYYAIDGSKVYFVVSQGVIKPTSGYFIAERIYTKPKTESSFLILEESKENNRVIVTAISDDERDIKPGDVVMIETMADYEVVFQYQGKEKRLIRVKKSDMTGFDRDFVIDNEIMRTGI